MALDSDTMNELVNTVGRFVRERLRPLEEQVADNDAIPVEIRQEIANLGLFGLTIPEEYGGLGLNMEEEVRIALELGKNFFIDSPPQCECCCVAFTYIHAGRQKKRTDAPLLVRPLRTPSKVLISMICGCVGAKLLSQCQTGQSSGLLQAWR